MVNINPVAAPVLRGNRFANYQQGPFTVPDVGPLFLWVGGAVNQAQEDRAKQDKLEAQNFFLNLEKSAEAEGRSFREAIKGLPDFEGAGRVFQQTVYGLLGDKLAREVGGEYQKRVVDLSQVVGDADSVDFPNFGKVYKEVESEYEGSPVLTNSYAKMAYNNRLLAERRQFEDQVLTGKAKEFTRVHYEERVSNSARAWSQYGMNPTAPEASQILQTQMDAQAQSMRKISNSRAVDIALNGLKVAVADPNMDPNAAMLVLAAARNTAPGPGLPKLGDDIEARTAISAMEDEVSRRISTRENLEQAQAASSADQWLRATNREYYESVARGEDPAAVSERIFARASGRAPLGAAEKPFPQAGLSYLEAKLNGRVVQTRQGRQMAAQQDATRKREVFEELRQGAFIPDADLGLNAGPVLDFESRVRYAELDEGQKAALYELRERVLNGQQVLADAQMKPAIEGLLSIRGRTRVATVQAEIDDEVLRLTDEATREAATLMGIPNMTYSEAVKQMGQWISGRTAETSSRLRGLADAANTRSEEIRRQAMERIAGFESARDVLDTEEARRLLGPQTVEMLQKSDAVSSPFYGVTNMFRGGSVLEEIGQRMGLKADEISSNPIAIRAASEFQTNWIKTSAELKKSHAGHEEQYITQARMTVDQDLSKIVAKAQKEMADQAALAAEAQDPESGFGRAYAAFGQALDFPDGVFSRTIEQAQTGNLQRLIGMAGGSRLVWKAVPYASTPQDHSSVIKDYWSSLRSGDGVAAGKAWERVEDALIDAMRSKPHPLSTSKEGGALDIHRRVLSTLMETRGVTMDELREGKAWVQYSEERLASIDQELSQVRADEAEFRRRNNAEHEGLRYQRISLERERENAFAIPIREMGLNPLRTRILFDPNNAEQVAELQKVLGASPAQMSVIVRAQQKLQSAHAVGTQPAGR